MGAKVAIALTSACFVGQLLAQMSCGRIPVKNMKSTKSLGNNGFHVNLYPHPYNGTQPKVTGYVAGEKYTVLIEGWKTTYTIQTFRGFTLVALLASNENEPAGFFQVKEDDDVRWSTDCWHAVTHSSLHPKMNVSAIWQAPPTNEGCVLFKAAVLEYPGVWYMDDNELTKKLCIADGTDASAHSDDVKECCSCDEAKYELIFKGLWSNKTHPKDYPSLVHLTHLSDIIGASHSNRYSMWAYGAYASDGLKELAEWGNTQKYEEEIREQVTIYIVGVQYIRPLQKSEIRTIIKARGLWYPNTQGTARAMFRVDKYHHIVSLASMLGPSPDWVVGLSAFNLCLKNCTWLDEKTFHLFLFDSGVDSGITYMSPNNPTIPREPIKPITTKNPADPRSPFYNADSDTMPPIVELTLKKVQVYPSECKELSEYIMASRNSDNETETSEDLENKNKKECTVNKWTPWSLCSATCGKGIRMRTRVYLNPVKAHINGCSRQMNEKQFCNAVISVCDGSANFNDQCAVTTWAQWTPCNVKCGFGTRSRVRNYINPMAIKMCSVLLNEPENCTGPAGQDCNVKIDPKCEMTFWSEWSPCSRSCDEGIRLRTRLLYYPENQEHCSQYELIERGVCSVHKCTHFMKTYASEICAETVEKGQCDGIFPRYYYDATTKSCKRFTYSGCKGNRNNFLSEDQCMQTCSVTSSSDTEDDYTNATSSLDSQFVGMAQDCEVSIWSSWSQCSETCGHGKQERVRTIVNPSKNGGQACPNDLVEKSRCRLPPCPTVCRIGSWTQWSVCSVDCGTGMQIRQRFAPPGYQRLAPCPAHQTQKRICTNISC